MGTVWLVVFMSGLPLEELDELLVVESEGASLSDIFWSSVKMRGAFLVIRLVGRTVQVKFLVAHRVQGNFLSHFVFVFAQLLQAMGVRPADFGTMPFEAGSGSLLPSLPCTV